MFVILCDVMMLLSVGSIYFYDSSWTHNSHTKVVKCFHRKSCTVTVVIIGNTGPAEYSHLRNCQGIINFK